MVTEIDNSKRVALVTGANRGIGLEISRQLAKEGIQVLLGSRDVEKGKLAAESIILPRNKVLPVELDVTSFESIGSLAKMVNRRFGGLDILVNNAGVLLDNTDLPSKTDIEKITRVTFETNLFGTWKLCETFIPVMKERKYGRIVNVSSGAGQLSSLSEDLYSPAYSLSKAGINALTIILARELRGTNVLVNSMDPGWVRTDMGGSGAPRSVEEGADTAVWLATLPDDGPSGGFFRDRERVEW